MWGDLVDSNFSDSSGSGGCWATVRLLTPAEAAASLAAYCSHSVEIPLGWARLAP